MENFDFDAQPTVPRDQIYVSWSETVLISSSVNKAELELSETMGQARKAGP